MATATDDDVKLSGEEGRKQLAEYDVKATLDEAALVVTAVHRASKHEFTGRFGKEELLAIGFIPQQVRTPQGILRFVQAALESKKGLHAAAQVGAAAEGEGEVLRVSVVKEDEFMPVAYTFVLAKKAQEETAILHALVADLRAQLQAQQLPAGTVVMWSGSADAIPAGWRLCDGEEGTPDLRDRFLLGAGGERAIGDKGGSAQHAHDVAVAPHALTLAQTPAHQHGAQDADFLCNGATKSVLTRRRVAMPQPGPQFQPHLQFQPHFAQVIPSSDAPPAGFEEAEVKVGQSWQSATRAAGGGEPHSHDAAASVVEHLPPFFAMAFIVKL